MNTPLHIKLFFFAMMAFSCASVSTSDIDVETEYDPDAGFSSYRSFKLQALPTRVHDPEGQLEQVDMDVDAILQRLITRELKNQGLAEVDRDPDLVVTYAAGVDMTTSDLVENPHNKMRILQNAPMAALVVILVDTGTGYPVWVGKATGNLSSDTPESTRKKRIAYAVQEMFRHYPAH